MESLTSIFSAIADAVREKLDTEDTYKPSELAEAILEISAGADVSGVTATASDVLATKVIVNSSGNEVTGTMVNNGAVDQTIAINGSYTVPQGYHNGDGVVKTSTYPTKGATTYYATTESQALSLNGKVCTGEQTIAAVSSTNLTAENVKSGVVVSVSNGQSNIFSVTGTLAQKRLYHTQVTSSSTTKSYATASGNKSYNYVTIQRGNETFDFNPKGVMCVSASSAFGHFSWSDVDQTYCQIGTSEGGMQSVVLVGTANNKFNPNASPLVIPVGLPSATYDVFIIGD